MNDRLPATNSDEQGVALRQESFSGPLPPPEILRKFNEVIPGSAERIFKMAEEQFQHRVELERQVIRSEIEQAKWGQILGFVIAVFGLAIAGYISVYGNEWAGGIIGVGTLASLVGVFMYGSKQRAKEREEKMRAEDV